MKRRLVLALALAISWACAAAAHPLRSVSAADWLKPHMVDVGDGRQLNFTCVGKGSPTIVFQQGGDGAIANWAPVQQAVSALTRACYYDRSGFGLSDPPDKPVTGISVTDELHTLLRRAGIREPVVFVGHSIGGFYATLYADRFPEDVAGMVLVDPGFSGQFSPPPEQRQFEQDNIRHGEDHARRCAALAREGKLTEQTPLGCFKIEAHRTPEEREYLLHAFTRPYWYEAEVSQSENYFPHGEGDSLSMRQEEEARLSFGDIPLIVLTAGVPPRNGWDTDESWREKSRRWALGHDQIAARSTRGRSIVVPNAHHFIHLDNPQAVIGAIAEVVEAVRRGTPRR